MGARELLVDEDNSLAERMRRGRWRQIRRHVPGLAELRVVAAPLAWWSLAPVRPRLTVVNLYRLERMPRSHSDRG